MSQRRRLTVIEELPAREAYAAWVAELLGSVQRSWRTNATPTVSLLSSQCDYAMDSGSRFAHCSLRVSYFVGCSDSSGGSPNSRSASIHNESKSSTRSGLS